ncbi:MAG: TolC family protein [Kiritimatiellae bacterium]|nr:TolC family protein [Kiritimatiellia bacterium]
MMNRYLYSVASAVALLSGCMSLPSVGPDYEEPDFEMPENPLPDAGFPTSNLTAACEYRPAESNDDSRVVVSTNSMEKWWTRFDDRVLVDLVDGAVSNNVNYRIAQARLEQSNWELIGSYAAFLPGLEAEGNAIRSVTRDNNKYLRSSKFGAGLNMTWEIDIFGGSRRATEAALAAAEAAGWTVGDAWVSLVSQIGVQYINLRTTQALIDVARTNLVLQSETYDILKSRLDSGIGDELAVNQCAYIVEQTRARIPQLLAQEEALKNAIAVLAGVVPGQMHDILKPVTVKRDWLLAPHKVDALALNMIRSRPDVKAAERNLAKEVARVGIAESMWYPKLFINGGVGMESSKFSKLFDSDSFYASIGPSISWPFFQGGNVYAQIKVAEARVDEACLAYELSLQNAYGEVRDAYSAYTQEYHRYQALKSAVKAASDAVSISNDLYKNGLKDFNNVLDAQRSRLQLEEEYVVSRGQITLNLIELYRALGGGLAVQ